MAEHTSHDHVVAFLGLGQMGRRMVAKLVEAGERVVVWNRTATRAEGIDGVEVAKTPAEAARQADVIFSMVRDDEASSQVWTHPEHGALSGCRKGAIVVESSTVTLKHAKAFHEAARRANVTSFDAPVAGTLPQAEAGALIYFIGGGDKDRYDEQVAPIVEAMAGAQHFCGGPGEGAAMKLVVNALFASQVAVMAELLDVFHAADMDIEGAIGVLAKTPVCSPAAAGMGKLMAAGMYTPMFPIELVEKDLGYALEASQSAQGGGASSIALEATRRAFQEAIKQGYGQDHITGIRQLFTS